MKCIVCGAETTLETGVCERCTVAVQERIALNESASKGVGRSRLKFGERFHDLLSRVGLWGGILMLLGGGVWLIAGFSIGYLFSHAVVLLVLGLLFTVAGIIDRVALARRVRAADDSLAGGMRGEVKAMCPRCERVFIARYGDGLAAARCPGCGKKFRRSQITVAD